MGLHAFLLLAVVLVAVGVHGEEAKVYPVDKACLSCICKGVSKCDMTKKCTHNGGACGPFRITQPFWEDANKPLPKGLEEGFKGCAYDYDCSVEAVKTYMAKYAQDCNGDKKIDCTDYAHIFRLGGYGCSASLDNLFKSRFEECNNEKKS